MAKNRYYADSTQGVLESYEWLFREKLQELDKMARSMSTDLTNARVPNKQIPAIMRQFFAELWEQVAATEEQRLRRQRPDELEKGNHEATSEYRVSG
ncbi:hypothetical protein ACX1C1_04080 [Paenibacillus sp. strain BS8-2]